MQQTPVDRESGTDPQSITQPERISAILDEIQRHLVLIGVRLDADGPLYNSLLVRLDKTRNTLYLDEISPREEHERLRVGHEISIYASLRGIAIRFVVTVEEILQEAGHALYFGKYPNKINYLQRRDMFRVRLPLHDRRQIKLQRQDSETEFAAQLVDLSIKGFGLELRAIDIEQDHPGARFRYFDMMLPELIDPLSGTAVLINLRPSPRPDLLFAGFAIANLDPQTERALMRAALYYQREARKMGF